MDRSERRSVIGIGASAGGVTAVAQICAALPADLDAAIFVVIHVGAQGRNLLAHILDAKSPLTVVTASDGELWRRGRVFIAPADRHLLVMGDRVRLGSGPRENMSRPAADPLFRSIGVSCGPQSIGVVLTGHLNDGSAGLADLQRCGGITVVQNPGEAEAASMPSQALQSSAVDYRAPLQDMAELLVRLTHAPAGPPLDPPDSIRTEVDIALGHRVDTERVALIAHPVPLSCPDCGGVLSQMRSWPPLRFRCQIGHAFTGKSLIGRKRAAVYRALEVALRSLEERAVLAERMAEDARLRGRPAAAAANQRRAEESKRDASALKAVLLDKA